MNINFTSILMLFAGLIRLVVALALISVILFLIGKLSDDEEKQQHYVNSAKKFMFAFLLILMISGGICLGGMLFFG